ncbi:hypothetical protein F1559_004736 [Cyanidiococcus yangmingshanensis]|uniref:Uncharacterized protein n=1 Tax=Cyanidiococcus yangmingshanensis TaxID=2690220 RepID=A0A7J7IQH4_9RHOD|nr:hypothetical protein F1559_004736 [Cyanidiococcus yangmingshanensis]
MAIMLAPLMNVQDASLWLRELVLDGVFETTSDWEHYVVRHYQQQLSRELWKVLSSAEWLGNPARYVRSLYQTSKRILRQMHARLRRHQVHSALATLLEMSLGYLAQLGFVSFDILYRISSSLQRTILGSLVSAAETDSAALEAAEIQSIAGAIDAETIRIRNGLGDRRAIAGTNNAAAAPDQAFCGRGHSSAVAWAPNTPQGTDLWRRAYFFLALPLLIPLQDPSHWRCDCSRYVWPSGAPAMALVFGRNAASSRASRCCCCTSTAAYPVIWADHRVRRRGSRAWCATLADARPSRASGARNGIISLLLSVCAERCPALHEQASLVLRCPGRGIYDGVTGDLVLESCKVK